MCTKNENICEAFTKNIKWMQKISFTLEIKINLLKNLKRYSIYRRIFKTIYILWCCYKNSDIYGIIYIYLKRLKLYTII